MMTTLTAILSGALGLSLASNVLLLLLVGYFREYNRFWRTRWEHTRASLDAAYRELYGDAVE